MSYRAIIFDLDGTLVDTLADLTDAMNYALSNAALPTRSMDECRRFVGEGLDKYVARALPEGKEHLHRKVKGDFRAYYREHMLDQSRPYDGIGALLAELSRRGMPMSVLSNKPQDSVELMVERLLDRWEFAEVRGERDDSPLKPDPAAATQIADALGIDPRQFIFLGDSKTDMQTAVNAGMHPVGAAWGFRDAEELLSHGAKAVIERPMDLVDIIGGRTGWAGG